MDPRDGKPPIRLRENVILRPFSTFRMGDRAAFFSQVASPDELIAAASWAKTCGHPCRIVAGGSNVVFPDAKLKAFLIRIAGGKTIFKGTSCVADAGVPLGLVIEEATGRGLRGLETLSGIPGTIGGAVVGNAGAYGHSISEVVEKVEIWDGKRRRFLPRIRCGFEYRESVFKHRPWLLLRMFLRFKHGDARILRGISRKIVRLRREKYRPGLRCPGSFFKNVLVKKVSKSSLARIDRRKIIDGKIPAGYVLEQVGAKGMRVGGIAIAPFHGNLFINEGKATARDVRKLARILKRRVKKKFEICLEEEIRYL